MKYLLTGASSYGGGELRTPYLFDTIFDVLQDVEVFSTRDWNGDTQSKEEAIPEIKRNIKDTFKEYGGWRLFKITEQDIKRPCDMCGTKPVEINYTELCAWVDSNTELVCEEIEW